MESRGHKKTTTITVDQTSITAMSTAIQMFPVHNNVTTVVVSNSDISRPCHNSRVRLNNPIDMTESAVLLGNCSIFNSQFMRKVGVPENELEPSGIYPQKAAEQSSDLSLRTPTFVSTSTPGTRAS